jgi:outer membrane protein assembly factor BamB
MKMTSRAVAGGLLVFITTVTAADWPQWRGADVSGVSTEKALPSEWTPEKNIRWKSPIAGRGHSSPVIWANRIFLTTSVEGAVVPGQQPPKHYINGELFKHPQSEGGDRNYSLKVLCLDRDSGKILWEQTAFDGPISDDRHKKNTYASSTPATDGYRVYAFFGSEGLYAYDFKGKLAWKYDPGKLPNYGMGAGVSPILYQDLVILQCDVENGDRSYIVALDRRNGKEVWRAERKAHATWSTPIIVKAAQRAELVTTASELTVAYDPATGKELWRAPGVTGNAIPTAVANFDTVVVSSGYPEKMAIGIKLGGSGDLTGSSNIRWMYKKGTAYVPSPILYRDYVYLITDKGLMTCLDARTGEVKYEGARPPKGGNFSSSLSAFNGMILLTSEDGETYMIKAGPVYEVLRTNSVNEPVYTSLAMAAGSIYIRGASHLYRVTEN